MSDLRRFNHRRLAAAICTCFAVAALSSPCSATSSHTYVADCSDADSGSLRAAIANTTDGGTVDLSPLTCSTITLTSGQIEIPQQNLTVKYSKDTASRITVSGNSLNRVFHHTGAGALKIVGLNVTDGKYDNSNIYQAVPAAGGCIFSAGSVYLSNSSISTCTAKDTRGEDAAGGGIYALSDLLLSNSVVSGNNAISTARFADGGGAFVHGSTTIQFSSINDNVASGLGGANRGGGLAVVNAGSAVSTITYSTVSGNHTDRGGGLFVSGSGNGSAAVVIANSTISGNIADDYAAAAYLNGPVTLANTTVAFNQSASGPDIELESHTVLVEVESSVLSDNGNYEIGSQGYTFSIIGANNLVTGTTGGILLPLDTVTADPLLLPLANNGGQTLTHAFRDGSPAFGAGNNAMNFSADQRGSGFARTINGAVDMGAYEAQHRDVVFANGFD